MAEKKRLANIELLRALAMVMIVTMHFLREKNALPDLGVEMTGRRAFALLLESACIVAVNTYVFISGYMSSYCRKAEERETFPLKKAAAFLLQIWFYLFGILAALCLLGKQTTLTSLGANGRLYMLRSYVLPIESDTYFFATAYFLLLLVTPILNVAVRELEQKQLRSCLLAGLTMFCFLKSVNPIGVPIDRYGYDGIWFVLVYLVGAYLQRYELSFLKKRPGLIYGCSVAVIFAVALVTSLLMTKMDAMKYLSSLPFHYNFVFVLTGAIGLFYCFWNISLPEGKGAELIRRAGKYSFGVYLFHEHPDLRNRWYPFVQRLLCTEGKEGILTALLEYAVSLLLLFLAGYLMEGIRVCLMNVWKRSRKPAHEGK